MKTKIMIAAVIALVFASISLPAFALIVYLEEGGSRWTGTGTMWDITDTGRGGHAYQYLSYYYGGPNGYSTGKWKVNTGEPTNTYWWWAWVPYNEGSSDAVVSYTVNGGNGSSFSLPVNQERYADQWVYLGEMQSGTANGYAYMNNSCIDGYGCSDNYQVWWDDVMYQHP